MILNLSPKSRFSAECVHFLYNTWGVESVQELLPRDGDVLVFAREAAEARLKHLREKAAAKQSGDSFQGLGLAVFLKLQVLGVKLAIWSGKLPAACLGIFISILRLYDTIGIWPRIRLQ